MVLEGDQRRPSRVSNLQKAMYPPAAFPWLFQII